MLVRSPKSAVVTLLILLGALWVLGCGDSGTTTSAGAVPSTVTPSSSESTATSSAAGRGAATPGTSQAERAAVVPEALAGIPMAQYLEGDAARVQTEQLHGKALGAGLDEAYLAAYGEGQATLWVTRSLEETDAIDLFDRMQTKIAESDTPFTNPQTVTVSAVPVEALDGMGQKHYYFRVGRDLYWLAIDPEPAQAGLQELVDNAVQTDGSE